MANWPPAGIAELYHPTVINTSRCWDPLNSSIPLFIYLCFSWEPLIISPHLANSFLKVRADCIDSQLPNYSSGQRQLHLPVNVKLYHPIPLVQCLYKTSTAEVEYYLLITRGWIKNENFFHFIFKCFSFLFLLTGVNYICSLSNRLLLELRIFIQTQ